LVEYHRNYYILPIGKAHGGDLGDPEPGSHVD